MPEWPRPEWSPEVELSSLANVDRRRRRLIVWTLVGVAFVFLFLWLVGISQIPPKDHGPSGPWSPGDTEQYIRAAQRLNAGEPLYGYDATTGSFFALGDYNSPPLLAVVFRAVVLLPGSGMYFWWAVMASFEIAALIALARRVPLITSLAMIALGLSIGMELWQGNVDCMVIPGLILTWYWFVQGHELRAGLAIGLLASLKLTPLAFVWCLFVTGRRRAAGVALGCGVALAVVTMIGSTPLIFWDFVGVTNGNLTAPSSAFGSSGLAYALGLPPLVVTWLPRLILIGGIAAMWICRRRPGVAWAIGAVMMWLGSPVASVHTPALLLVALAPLAWPMRDQQQEHGARRGGPDQQDPATAANSLVHHDQAELGSRA